MRRISTKELVNYLGKMSDAIDRLFILSNKLRKYPFCHSRPDRSFCYNNRYFGLCARCTAMYASGLIFIFLFPFRSGVVSPISTITVGLILLLPTALDGFTQLFGIRESNNQFRVITGIPLGIGAVLISEGAVILLYNLF